MKFFTICHFQQDAIFFYTGEDFLRHAVRRGACVTKMGHPVGVSFQILNWYRSINELKCPILILQWCKLDLTTEPKSRLIFFLFRGVVI